jgi:hypothetical protein
MWRPASGCRVSRRTGGNSGRSGSSGSAWIVTGAIALAAVGMLAACNADGASRSADRSPITTAVKPAKDVKVYATYYGWFDNTPPGCATAYSGCAGGIGSYRLPITFASDKQEFPVGSVLYYPAIKKYIRMGDDCQECDQDWAGDGPDGGPRFHHVDIWIGGKSSNAFEVINCENALTCSPSNRGSGPRAAGRAGSRPPGPRWLAAGRGA